MHPNAANRFDDELHAMLAQDLSVSEASGYFRGLAGVDLPHGTQRQQKTRETVLGQMLGNFDNDRNALPGVKHTAWVHLRADLRGLRASAS